jgi:hypothetical protein
MLPVSLNLTAGQVAALAHVRALAERRTAETGQRLAGLDDAVAICAAVREHGRITLNFHPDRLLADGRTVAGAMAADLRYRAQYETFISNGSRTAFPGGMRDDWERILFGGAYHHEAVVPADRPKYGAFNLLNHADGGAPRFGSCHLRLRPAVNERATFTFGDTATEPTDVGTIDAFGPVLAALMESATGGSALGVPVDDLTARLRALGADASGVMSRALDDYIEAQVHGSIDLGSDVEAIIIDPSFRGKPAGDALVSTGLPIEWTAGYALDAADVSAEFRVPEMPAFAADIVTRLQVGDRLDAEIIGRAAASIVHDPGAWAEWGDQDEALQLVKKLWHILVAFGEPYGANR